MKKYVSLSEHGIVPLSLWDWIFQEMNEMMLNEMVIKGHVGHHRSIMTTEGFCVNTATVWPKDEVLKGDGIRD